MDEGGFVPKDVEVAGIDSELARQSAEVDGIAVSKKVADNIESGRAADAAATITQLTSLTKGEAITGPITADVQSTIQATGARLDAQSDVIGKLGGDAGALKGQVGKVSIDDTFDPVKNPKNAKLLDNSAEYVQERFNIKTQDDIAALSKKLEEKAAKEPNPTTREKLIKYAKIIGGLTILGGVLTGLIELFKHLADEKSGCFQLDVGSGKEDVKLDCGATAMSSTNCNCTGPDTFKILTGSCGVTSDQSCAPTGTYRYIYRHYSAWDVFCDFVDTAVDDVQKSFDFLDNIGKFFTQYGIWIFLGLLILIGAPLIFSLIKISLESESLIKVTVPVFVVAPIILLKTNSSKPLCTIPGGKYSD